MNRKGALIALAVAVLVGVVFGLLPEFDLWMSAIFFDPVTENWILNSPLGTWMRRAAAAIIALIVAPAFVALALKLFRPHRPMLMPGRAALLMVATLTLGPGLITNTILKDNSGRPRPIFVVQFGGDEPFFPWWDPRGACDKNCSFVAGEPSGAFWTLAPAALTPPAWRAAAYGAALTFGVAVGFLRMAGGGHFFTDVVFAGVFTFLLIWLMHGLIYRWRPTRIEDASVEHVIEKEAMRWRRGFGWIAVRLKRGVGWAKARKP
jgi:membrane-associated PAP2 superfamily phosphatase